MTLAIDADSGEREALYDVFFEESWCRPRVIRWFATWRPAYSLAVPNARTPRATCTPGRRPPGPRSRDE